MSPMGKTRRWTRQDWQKVPSLTSRGFVSPEVMVGFAFIVERNERYTKACTLERDRFGGGSVMVWCGVSQHHRTELVAIASNLHAVHYREDILLPHVVPFLQAHPDMTIQHDNATSHTARSVRDFLQDRNVSVLPWPAVTSVIQRRPRRPRCSVLCVYSNLLKE